MLSAWPVCRIISSLSLSLFLSCEVHGISLHTILCEIFTMINCGYKCLSVCVCVGIVVSSPMTIVIGVTDSSLSLLCLLCFTIHTSFIITILSLSSSSPPPPLVSVRHWVRVSLVMLVKGCGHTLMRGMRLL